MTIPAYMEKMETTIKPDLPYRKSVLSDGTIEVALPSIRGGVLLAKIVIAAAIGLAFVIFWIEDAISVKLNLSGWFVLPALALAAYVPYWMYRKLMRRDTIFHIIPQQGIKFIGKELQLAFADIDGGAVSVESKWAPIKPNVRYHITAKMTGVSVSLLASTDHEVASAVAHLINQYGPHARPR